jgi:hypothetical protein
MTRIGIRTVALALAALAAIPAFGEAFEARLGRVPIDSRTQSDVAGLGRASAELDGSRLVIRGEFGGLLGPATVANLHMGRAVGVRGPVIESLTVTGGVDGELEGELQLTADQVAALRAGRLYVQLHSETAPDGNLWGWLLNDE